MSRLFSCQLAITTLLAAGTCFFHVETKLLAQITQYPQTRTVDQTDDYHGEVVADPYRWLENEARVSEDVALWVAAQNAVTFGYLESLPARKDIERRLTELWDYEKYSTPFRIGGHYYYSRNDGLQNQNVLYQLDSLDAVPRELIDPNKWSADGTIALSGLSFDDAGQLLAFGQSSAGSDWTTWHVMNVATGEILPDTIEWTKFSNLSWTPDGRGFYYSRFDKPDGGAEFQSLNRNQKVYYHTIGEAQSDDRLIHEDPENPDWGFNAEVTEDGHFLVITVWKGTDDKYRVMVRDLTRPGSGLVTLIGHFDNEYSLIGNEGPVLFFKSDFQAPNKCVLAIDFERPQPENWQVIIPETAETLVGASMVGDSIFADYLRDAVTLVRQHDLAGKLVREISLPGLGSASGFGGRREHDETFYSFSSFSRPPSIYRLDLASGESTLFKQANVDFNPEDYEVRQVFYSSRDGTRIPMFIAHRKGLVLNGQNPTLLYGYGGFNIPLTPGFSVTRLQWMEMGGVFAMPNLRGGGEYGEKWHQAGTRLNKQNVFDDFIAAAEWLIENGYTSSKHLAIQGRSNGGLLVGACMTQRPDLFAACLPGVGVMDMLRFQKFTAGRFWVDDYGSSEASREEFDALRAYSPYHNIRDGVSYPPTMIVTADTDDRVVPGHSFKFAARLQAAHAGSNPVLIRIETGAGHGAGKPTAKIIEEAADEWTFIAEHTGLKPEFPTK